MNVIKRLPAHREVAMWFLDQFEQHWNSSTTWGGYTFDCGIIRKRFAQEWLKARTISLIHHDHCLMVDDCAGFNRERIKRGEPLKITKVID